MGCGPSEVYERERASMEDNFKKLQQTDVEYTKFTQEIKELYLKNYSNPQVVETQQRVRDLEYQLEFNVQSEKLIGTDATPLAKEIKEMRTNLYLLPIYEDLKLAGVKYGQELLSFIENQRVELDKHRALVPVYNNLKRVDGEMAQICPELEPQRQITDDTFREEIQAHIDAKKRKAVESAKNQRLILELSEAQILANALQQQHAKNAKEQAILKAENANLRNHLTEVGGLSTKHRLLSNAFSAAFVKPLTAQKVEDISMEEVSDFEEDPGVVYKDGQARRYRKTTKDLGQPNHANGL